MRDCFEGKPITRAEFEARLESGTAFEIAAEHEFMRRLKAKSPLLDIRSYEDWMGSRSHSKLL